MQVQILGDRYRIQEQLGKKAGRRTFLARDQQTQELVVLKLLSFSNDFEWDSLKLFEREANTLKALSHPCIPRYLAHFDLNLSDCKGFALVQTYINGKSLENHVKIGRTFDETEIKQIAKQILEILVYLHGRQPSVIHRDIKPSNILLTNRSGHQTGEIYLVDFGSVQTLAATESGTITVVGSYGYMPLEQFGGRAVPASDLYGLGATLIYLATGSHPADLPQKDGKIQFERITSLSPGLIRWLKQMTEPTLEKRFVSAQAALQALEQSQLEYLTPALVYKPNGSKVLINKEPDCIEIIIPSSGFNPLVLGLSLFTIAWNSFLLFWTISTQVAPFPLNILFDLFSLPFWGVGIGLIIGVLFQLFGSQQLQINQTKISFIYKLFLFKYNRFLPAPRENINKLVYIARHFTRDVDGDRIEVPAQLIIWAGVQKFQLGGTNAGTQNDPEIEWLAQELSDWLGLAISKE